MPGKGPVPRHDGSACRTQVPRTFKVINQSIWPFSLFLVLLCYTVHSLLTKQIPRIFFQLHTEKKPFGDAAPCSLWHFSFGSSEDSGCIKKYISETFSVNKVQYKFWLIFSQTVWPLWDLVGFKTLKSCRHMGIFL